MPSVRVVTSSPVRSRPAAVGPRSKRRAKTPSRSSCLTPAAACAAAASAAQESRARNAMVPRRNIRGVATCVRVASPRKTLAIT